MTPQQAFVSARNMWRVSNVTSASLASLTWPRTMSLAAHPASATATPPSAPRPVATLRVGVVALMLNIVLYNALI